ncbi:MAG: 2-hydroxyacyl-CoA dehydratase family protein [Oscillospiraceae bacterium]
MLKTNIEWIKKNVPSDMKIWKEMISEINWADVGSNMKRKSALNRERISGEWKDFAGLSSADKLDRIMNGERQLGRLYQKGAVAFTRREWKGVESTARDFAGWLAVWRDMLIMVMKDPLSIAIGLFEYRWFSSYLACPAFVDRNTLGFRGRAVTMNHLLLGDVYRYTENVIATLLMADRRVGGNDKINDKLLLFDEMTMAQMMGGFPDLLGIPYQLIPVFLVSELDQLICVPYIDAVESYGLPADTCPVPTSECGSAILDALPHCGLGFISTSTPCDGSDMATSYQNRRIKMPTYPLTLPVRYDDEDTVDCGAEDMKHCIKWVEDLTGHKWDWDSYFEVIRRFNEQTKMEMEKWEINCTPYPQLIGPCYELFRKWNYEMDGGLEPRVMKTFYKVREMMYKSYEEKANPYRHELKYRAVVWSCPAHYYANFSNWLANSWGIGVLVEMESLNFTKELNTTDHDEAIRDLARLYERMVMRKHTNGGYIHVLDELWKVCEQFNANFIIMYQHVCCKTMAGLQGLFDEQARERGLHLIWVEHDLMDPRTVSRRDMRAKVSNYMRAIIQAEPVDESLIEFEDDITW